MQACCDDPVITSSAPAADDPEETVEAMCGHCGHDYGPMSLAKADKLEEDLQEAARDARAARK